MILSGTFDFRFHLILYAFSLFFWESIFQARFCNQTQGFSCFRPFVQHLYYAALANPVLRDQFLFSIAQHGFHEPTITVQYKFLFGQGFLI